MSAGPSSTSTRTRRCTSTRSPPCCASPSPRRTRRGDVLGAGPVIIGYDGSPAAERALRETATLLAGRSGLVVCVWEPGLAYQMLLPGFVPAPIDIRVAREVDEEMYDRARRLAEQGASRARDLGLAADGLAVADELTPAQTLVRLATERDAAALGVGGHGHRAVRELLLGSTSRDVVRLAPCPVVLVHGPGETKGEPADAPSG